VGRAPAGDVDAPDVVYRYGRDGRRLMPPVAVDGDIAAIVATAAGVAAATTGSTPRLHRISADGGDSRKISLLRDPIALARGAGAVWVSMPPAAVTRVGDRGELDERSVVGGPAQLAVTGARVFVALTTRSAVAVLRARDARPAQARSRSAGTRAR
jgi:hypothetical protein